MAPNKTYELKAVFTAEDNSGDAVNSMARRLDKLEKKLEKMDAHLNVTVSESGADHVESRIEDLEKRTKGVIKAKVSVEFDEKQANKTAQRIASLDKQAKGVSQGLNRITFSSNADDMSRGLKGMEAHLSKLSRGAWDIALGDNTKEAKNNAKNLIQYLNKQFGRLHEIRVRMDSRQAMIAADEINARAENAARDRDMKIKVEGQQKLKSELGSIDKAARQLALQLNQISLKNDEDIRRGIKFIDKDLDKLTGQARKIQLQHNTPEVQARVKNLMGYIDQRVAKAREVKLLLETRDFERKAAIAQAKKEKAAEDKEAVLRLNLRNDFLGKIDLADKRLAALTSKPAVTEFKADISEFNRSLSIVRKSLDTEINRVYQVEIRAEAEGFDTVAAQANAIRMQLMSLRDAKVNLEANGFMKALMLAGAVKTEMDEVTKKYVMRLDTSSLNVGRLAAVGMASAATALANHLRTAGSVSQDFARGVYIAQQAMYVFRVAILAVAIGALGPLVAGLSIALFSLTALAGGLGLVAMAAMPIAKAFAEQEQNANKLKSAQDGLKTSAEGVRTANEGLADAQRSVIDTQRQGIESVNAAVQANQEAQRGVIDAQRAVGEAHQGVTDAMVSRQESITSAVESHKDAVRSLNDAIINRRESINSAYESHKDAVESLAEAVQSRQEAINKAHESYRDAVEAVHEAVISRQESIKSAYDSHKDAIRSLNDAIESRQERIASALESQRDAVQGVADAIVGRREAIQSAMDAHADAIESVNDAQRAAVRSQRDLYDANLRAADATKEFNYALQTEKYRIQDLKYEIQGLSLDSRELALDLADAREELNEASTSEERERAQIRLERLMLREKQLTEDQRQAQVNLNDAQKEGSQELQNASKSRLDALRAQKDAQYGVTEAEKKYFDALQGVREAEQDITKARIKGDRQVAEARENAIDAEKSLLKARRDGDRQVSDARKAVLKAEQGLMKARRDGDKQVADARKSALKAEQDIAKARRDGDKRVSDAREAALKAEQNIAKARRDGDRQVADARRAMLKAEKNVIKARRDGDRQVADARKQVADAQRALVDANRKAMESERAIGKARADAARANENAMRGLLKAQRNLADAQEKHKTALQEVNALMQKTTGITAAVLAKGKELGAAYRTSFKEATDSAGLLAIKMMDLGIRIMPQLGRTANETILGIDAGLTKVGQNYAAYGVLDSMKNILRGMPGITEAWTVAFGNFGGAFLNIMSQAMPYALRFAQYIARTGERFMRWADSAQGRADIKKFFDAAAPVAKALFRQIARIGGALLRWSIEHPEAVAAAITTLGDVVMTAAKWISRAVRFWKAMPEPMRDVIKLAAGVYIAFRFLPAPIRLAALWLGRMAGAALLGGGAMGTFGKKAKGAAGKTRGLRAAAMGAGAAVGAKGLAGKLRGAGAGMGTLNTKSAKARKEMRTMRGAAQKSAASLAGKKGLAGAAGTAGASLGAKGLLGSAGRLASRLSLRMIPVLGTAWLALDALSVASGNGLFGIEEMRKGVGNFASFVGLKVPEAGTEFMWLRAVVAVAGDKIKAKLKGAFAPMGNFFKTQWGQIKKDFNAIANWFENSWANRVSKSIRKAFTNPMKGNQEKSMQQIRGVARKIFSGWQPEVDKKMRETNRSVKNKSRKTAQDGAREYGKFPKGVSRHNQEVNRNIQKEMAKARREVLAETGTIKNKGSGNVRSFGNQSSDVMKAYARMVNTETKIARERGIEHTSKMKGVSLQNIKDLNNDGRINMRELEAGITLQTKQARDNSNKHTQQQQKQGVENARQQKENSTRNMKELMHNIDKNTNEAKKRSTDNTQKMQEKGVQNTRDFRDNGSRTMAEAAVAFANNTRKGVEGVGKWLSEMSKGVITVAKELGIAWEGLKTVAKNLPIVGPVVRLADMVFASGGTYKNGEAHYAKGGSQQAPKGGVATSPTRVYGEVPGTKEFYITDNPRYRERNLQLLSDANEHMMAKTGGWHKADRQKNSPPGPMHWDKTPPNANARRHANQMANRRGRQEGFGPATYTLVKPLKAIADKIAGKYGLTWNSYLNHPPGMGPQPFYRERSVDWWGSGGRGDPIGSVWTKVANDARAMTGPDFDYMLTPGNDPAGHWDHVHLTAFTGKHGLETATGSGRGPDVGALIEKHIPKVPDMGAGLMPDLYENAMKKIREVAVKKLEKHAPSGNWNGSGNVDEWVKKGLELGGAFPPSAPNIRMMVSRAMQESGGDPNAINRWDSNWLRGTPSKGLMQIIEGTWNANTTPGIGQFAENWSNPIKSVAVSSRYMKNQYGHIVGANGQGYSKGGVATAPHIGLVGEGGGSGEVMWPLHDKKATRAITKAVQTGVQTRETSKGYYDIPAGQGAGVKGTLANKLYAQGWRGRPGDRAERLYAPRNAGRPGYVQAEDGSWVPNSFYSRPGVGNPRPRIGTTSNPLAYAESQASMMQERRFNNVTSRVFSRQNVRNATRNGSSNTQIVRNSTTQSGDNMAAKEIKRMTDRLEAKLDEQLESINIANMDKIIELSVKTALGTILSKGGRDAIDKQLADKMEFDLGLKGIL